MKKTIKWIIFLLILIIPLTWLALNIDNIQKNISDSFTEQNDNEGNHRISEFLKGSRETENFGEYEFSDFDSKHYGIDYHLPEDTPIQAATDGTVTRTFNNDLGGKVVQISEPNGQYHQWYMHLNDFKVKVGDEVQAGDTIALSGNTGEQTTGAHLHFQRMRDGVGNAYAIDPAKFIDELPKGEKSLYQLEK
ncbi:M23 family metallopeptidase [Staphylococcus caeli]|uniref:M23 family metallopeptidase n=1 Tax=Staphylococcus caeli TaxID=2201815 RepID=UPI003F547A44